MNNQSVVLITGASSGIGRQTALLMAERGYRVYGTSRDPKKVILPDKIKLLKMELSDESSILDCISHILKEEGRIDILINNAGFGLAGAIEDTTRTEAVNQLDVNFFGPFCVINAVLPSMRKQGKGKIINIGSVAGFIPIPFQAFYSAGKFALEALSIALRMEVKPFGISVTIIEPGDLNTGFTANRVYTGKSNENTPYKRRFDKSISVMIKDEKNGPKPDIIAEKIIKVAERKKPPSKIVVGLKYKVFAFIKRIIPQSLLEYILMKLY